MVLMVSSSLDFARDKLARTIMRGKLIVFEGADGSGKTTQSKLLLQYLKKRKISSRYISFPRYEQSLWGKMIARFLRGDFGKLADVDPYLASCLYAGDRLVASTQMKEWLSKGYTVVCNRYVGSNIAHMAAKIKSPAAAKALAGRQSERSKYIKWLEELEYGENKIPREDLVIFLYVPIEVSRKLMRGRKLDIHEDDLEYQKRVLAVYDNLCQTRKNWVKVECTKNGQILNAQEIHRKVIEIIKSEVWFSKNINI